MNFEKVELYGFKSFADKAEIKFGNGITAIVGPNGCGKSNVADAIRWVMGEQSAKNLRGSSMQDVIFSGTQNRKSLSYCEVSLYFDNTNRMFSLDYNEVIITRKLYRSGESEYFINKQPSRLKDIVDLLHECGIGKEGYSIIGQGKVEEIMSAKPEDRRMIFEEATGIAIFKARKNESERKLARTHENITRFNDIMFEIENQLEPLGKQAEKAKEFNELSEQLKFHEINTYIAKIDGVATEKAKVNTKIDGLNEQITLRFSELAKTQKEHDDIFDEISKADEKLRKLNDELLEKRVGIEKFSGAKKLYEEKISFLRNQIEKSKSEIEANNNLVNDCNNTISLNHEQIKISNKSLEQLTDKFDKLNAKYRLLSEKIALGEELVSANQKKIIQSIEQLTDFKVNKGSISVEIDNLNAKLDEYVAKLDTLSVKREGEFNEKDKYDKNIDELDRSIYELKNTISSKEDQVHSCNEDVAACDNKIYSLNSLISSLVTKDNFYRSMKDAYEGYAPSVKLLMSKAKDNPELKSRIKGVIAELIKSDKKYDVALETALSAAAQNVVTSTPDDAKYLIDYLKANKFGRITFLPISSVKPRNRLNEVNYALDDAGVLGVAVDLISYDKQFATVISSLLENILIVEDTETATRIVNKYHNKAGFRIVTLDGDLFNTQGAITGGSRRSDSLGLLSSDRRIEENEKLLSEKRLELDELKDKKQKLEVLRDNALSELSVFNDAYNEKRQQLLVEREKQAVSEKNLSEIGREIENTTDIIDEIKGKIEKITLDMQNLSTDSKKLEEERFNAHKVADEQQHEFSSIKMERETVGLECTEIQVSITELKGKISSLTADNERLNLAVKEANDSSVSLNKSIEGAEGIIEELKREEEKVSLTKEELEYVNKVRQDIDDMENNKTVLREKLNKNDEEREVLNNQLNELSDKKHAQEIALTKIDSDLEYMGQSIFDDYQETYETAIKYKEEGYEAHAGEIEVARLRKKRSSLGAINATAIDDYKILKERYDEMIAQKEDLEKAEADLQEAIAKIKAEMLTKFDEGFNVINKNFQEIFKQLFGGGRAMLELDYSESPDKLEAGIEIIAEPPGKKLQKLSLLSGGEKALTAIAILFSILKMRPMPFCVLDEIEAALDEANVDRFASYLQKFSEETQFIVITHRKPTMEMADALFGVTMQEKGVSRMVSVKLSDIADIDSESIA